MGIFNIDGVALVTGASSGIGREIALTFAEAGASGVVFADIDINGAREVSQESVSYATNDNYKAFAIEVDVTSEESVQRMVDETVAQFGQINYSINSAGVASRPTTLQNLSLPDFQRVYNVNVFGTTLCMRAVMKVMASQIEVKTISRSGERSLGRGCIINLGSMASYVVGPNMLPYVTSKHALMGLTKAAAAGATTDGIRVNAVCPSFVTTPMTQPLVRMSAGKSHDDMKGLLGPLGRMAYPEEVSGAVLFLCSPAASYINGIGMIIDAGMTLPSHA